MLTELFAAWLIQARPHGRQSCYGGVGAAHRQLCDRDAGEVTLEAGNLCSLAQPKDSAGQAAQHPPEPAWGYSDRAHREI